MNEDEILELYLVLSMISFAVLATDYIQIRRWWVRPFIPAANRLRYGAYSIIFNYFKYEDYELLYIRIILKIHENVF